MPHRSVEPKRDPEEDTTYVYSRSEDRSFWAWTAALIEKYKLLIWALGALLVAAGFGFKTPNQIFEGIHQEIETIKTHEKSAEVERHEQDMKIDMLLRLRCYEVEEEHAEQQALLAGLNCGKILRGE